MVTCEYMARRWREERREQEACVIACVLFYALGWPIINTEAAR